MSAIRLQHRTPVAVKVMGMGHKRQMLLTPKGRLAFPNTTHEEIQAEQAYAVLAGGSARTSTVLHEYRRVCAQGNVSRALPKPLFFAAMDGFAVKTLRDIRRVMEMGQPYQAVDRRARHFLTAHCSRTLRACFARCQYSNYRYEQTVASYQERGYHDSAAGVPRSCEVTPRCTAGFTKNVSVNSIPPEYYNGSSYTVFIHFNWAWYRDVYLRGLAVVENHLVLRYLQTLSPTLHRVSVVVQKKGVNAFHEEERLVWQTGEGTLLLRP